MRFVRAWVLPPLRRSGVRRGFVTKPPPAGTNPGGWLQAKLSKPDGGAAAATTRRLRSRVSPDEPTLAANWAALSLSDIAEAVASAAKRLHVAIYSDADIVREAENIIRRVEAELESLQRAGEMKSVNRSYRAYRMDASARGEKVHPYAKWLNDYRANLVRQLAAALRDA